MVSDTIDTFIKFKCSLKFSCSIILVTTHYADGSLWNHYKYKFLVFMFLHSLVTACFSNLIVYSVPKSSIATKLLYPKTESLLGIFPHLFV